MYCGTRLNCRGAFKLTPYFSFKPFISSFLAHTWRRGFRNVEVAARTVGAMLELGARHFYVSNLPLARAHETLGAIMERAGVTI